MKIKKESSFEHILQLNDIRMNNFLLLEKKTLNH